ncbi:MAG TPA: glutamate--cysteine ligase [Caulobacteraceae bacterium]|nr:glutamate--cysteine ligase [Caulobacteraceae bacterium]
MADSLCDDRPLTFDDLVADFDRGFKAKADFRVGSEHEKFVFRKPGHESVAYEGEAGIHVLLTGLRRYGWSEILEHRADGGETLIGLSRGGASVSLEPGGQFELSGAPLESVHDICLEIGAHLTESRAVAAQLGLGFLGLGFTPEWTREQVAVMPKGRYKIMAAYMPKVGRLGLDMMFRTCTVQANLDFASEADMAAKMRLSLALQPLATALFANSPFVEGKPTGYLSSRARVWTDTDPTRTGMLDFVFQDRFGFADYARWALDAPMYFVKRDGLYVDASGQSFRAFMAGELPALPGEKPTIQDWRNHLNTLFPEVRLQNYLEMRGADTGPPERLCALAAFWMGLLYDDAATASAWDLVKHWQIEDHERLRADSARLGLKAIVDGRSLQALALDVLAIARQGLKNRGKIGPSMTDETGFLAPLDEIAETGLTAADRWLELYNGPWRGDLSKIYEAAAY